jgi:subtilisin-like proprotein convertase family protein
VDELVQLPESARRQILDLLAEKEARTPAQRKIGSSLLYAGMRARGASLLKSDPHLQPLVPPREDGRVDVEIFGSIGKPLIEAVEEAGGELFYTGRSGQTLRALLSLDAVERLARRADVRRIAATIPATTHRSPAERAARVRPQLRSAIERLQPRPADDLQAWGASGVGAVTSQGDVAHRVDQARRTFGVDGTGIKIGVISDSDDFKEASIASGDLPADTVTLPGQNGRPGSGEGTAMMEIVHDLAPGAKLYFAAAFNSPESFADNIRTLRFTYGCDIIVDDVIYYFESPFQDVGGAIGIAKAVEDVTADGALYFSSAGNQGNLDDGTSGTWEGDFKERGTLPSLPVGYTVHDFGRRVVTNRIEVGGGPLTLHWSDAFDSSANDYDLFVLTPDLAAVTVAATDVQDGDDIPFEFLGFDIPADYRVVVAKKAGSEDRAIHTVLFHGELALATSGGTFGHSAVAAAFSVAAVDVALAQGGPFTAGPTMQVELFSTDGNRRVFFDSLGNPFTPDCFLFAKGCGEVRKKPDLTAADGVATTLPSGSGLNPFFGTSAAAPHAAAIAALFKQAKPSANPTKLRNALTKPALDIEADGRDRDSGFGIVDAMGGLTFLGATPVPFLQVGTNTVTPTSGDGDPFLDPGESASMVTQLMNTGGATPLGLGGTLTTSLPGVTITTGSAAYPAIAPGGAGLNSPPFALSLSPSVACGVKVPFTLTASYTNGGPKTLNVDVQTGEPSGAVSTFAFTGPRAAIPDNNPAGVNVSIPVSGVGTVSKVTFSVDGTTCSTAVGSATVGLDHSWVGDLLITLRSPSGTTVTLANRPGGQGNSGNNFCKTVFTDAAVNSIQNVTIAQAPYTGSFKPASPLSAFVGDNASGTWVLNVADLEPPDTGGVRAVSLNISGYTCN